MGFQKADLSFVDVYEMIQTTIQNLRTEKGHHEALAELKIEKILENGQQDQANAVEPMSDESHSVSAGESGEIESKEPESEPEPKDVYLVVRQVCKIVFHKFFYGI